MGNLVTSTFSGSSSTSSYLSKGLSDPATIGNQTVRAVHGVALSLTCLKVQKLVDSHTVVVISKSYCPYSRMAKEALANYNLPPDDLLVWEIDGEENTAEIQQCLKQMTGGRTVPRVFICGQFVGGGEDTVRLHKSGELAKLLAAAGSSTPSK